MVINLLGQCLVLLIHLFHFLLDIEMVLFDVGHEEVHEIDLSMEQLEDVEI